LEKRELAQTTPILKLLLFTSVFFVEYCDPALADRPDPLF